WIEGACAASRHERVDDRIAFFRLDRADRIDEMSTRPKESVARVEQARLKLRQDGQPVRSQPPADLGMAPQDTRPAAWSVDEDTIEEGVGSRRARGEIRGGGSDPVGRDPQRALEKTREPALVEVEGHDPARRGSCRGAAPTRRAGGRGGGRAGGPRG